MPRKPNIPSRDVDDKKAIDELYLYLQEIDDILLRPDRGWRADNVTLGRTFDTTSVTLAGLASVVGTLIKQLIDKGLIDP